MAAKCPVENRHAVSRRHPQIILQWSESRRIGREGGLHSGTGTLRVGFASGACLPALGLGVVAAKSN
jgi:hypothetical protein